MCTRQRYVFNRYVKKHILVNCGKCPACLQERANKRAQRIRNNVSSGTIALFCTFTYSNNYVPYIKRSELRTPNDDVFVYRNKSIRYIFDKTNGLRTKIDNDIDIIDTVFIPPYLRTDSMVSALPSLRGDSSDKIGVCLSSDFQKFIKRLRMYLKRVLKNEIHFTYFQCSEYGSRFKRPHFHALFFIPAYDEEKFRNALVACWPYALHSLTKDYIQIAKDAASYCASYVNSSNSLLPIIKDTDFRQKSSFSLHFGATLDCFSLSNLLAQADNRTCFYYREKTFDGTSCTDVLPIPAYVINRYFPKFKGCSVFPSDTLDSILLEPSKAFSLASKGFVHSFHPKYDYNLRECHQIKVRLENAYQYFHKETGLGRFDFRYYYKLLWHLRTHTVNKMLYEQLLTVPSDLCSFYENLYEYPKYLSDLTFLIEKKYIFDPNKRIDIQQKTAHLERLYYLKDKQKKVTNYIMAECGHNV